MTSYILFILLLIALLFIDIKVWKGTGFSFILIFVLAITLMCGCLPLWTIKIYREVPFAKVKTDKSIEIVAATSNFIVSTTYTQLKFVNDEDPDIILNINDTNINIFDKITSVNVAEKVNVFGIGKEFKITSVNFNNSTNK